MVVLVTCKNEEDPIKNEGARVVTCKNEEDPIINEGARVLTRFYQSNPMGESNLLIKCITCSVVML